MTSELAAFLVNVFVGGSVIAYLLQRKQRRIDYLRPLAGDRDLWNIPCDVCLKPMRDKGSVTDTTTSADGSTSTSISYHMGACSEVVRKRRAKDPS
ncbi:hypothetical protein [Streptomyces sp. WM6349]|uniref:hypothetical protein n=1 Tax=Streptomyces sp. WM6349 TaxID=1415552 RepID=UPI0006AE9076|nr:hypothetical protein [Streptomyces sp. WM6349]KOU17043.1 hypothetical protein ADK49_17045 [Streptomyces sp. WM6349]